MGRLVCPYCYDSFGAGEILFRCSGQPGADGRACERQTDERLERAFGFRDPLPPVFAANGRKLQARHGDCKEPTGHRVCPHCHSQLPVQFGKVTSRLIAMVGARETGKTVYMTVLIHELTNKVGARFNAALSGSDDYTRQRFVADYERRLYQDGQLFEATRSAGTRGGKVTPLVFRFTTERSGLLGTRPAHNLLSFFDSAGEDLASQDRVEANARYLANADAIILMLDPLQMPGARRLATADARLPALGTGDTPANLLIRVTELLQMRLGLGPTAQITKPVAVAFSKLDVVRHALPRGSPLLRPEGQSPRFDRADAAEVHEHVRALLHDWEGAQIDQLLRFNYARYRYFGLSALGESPTRDNLVSEAGIRPYRVPDPLLWLLSEFGTIPATPTPDGRFRS